MANQAYHEIVSQGVLVWNAWREANASIRHPDLSEVDLRDINLYGANFQGADLGGAIFRGVDLREANFNDATLCKADLSWARLYHAQMNQANLAGALLRGADLRGAMLASAVLVETNFTKADLTNCSVYGISAWEVNLTEAKQIGLVISHPDQPIITVDDLEIAQFIYLLLNHQKIRNVINSVTRRGVLILGRFGNGGLDLLQSIAVKLRELSYLPIIFDFDRPEGRDYTETVKTLVGLSRFVIVELSGPSVPQELYAVVPHFDVPIIPIIEKGKPVYSMFIDLLKYPWVLQPPLEFTNRDELIELIPSKIIVSAEEKYKERKILLDRIFHRQ